MTFWLYLDCDECATVLEFEVDLPGAKTRMLRSMNRAGGRKRLDKSTGRYRHLCKDCDSGDGPLWKQHDDARPGGQEGEESG